jgi:HAE1 family hydrophobic/amphiphilic exporter-1
MDEVSGPVIAIALILSAVFIPTAFIPGITGRMYQQFAVTIAVSVIFSAFNALTLSPALSAMLLRPRKQGRGPLAIFFRWFNKVFGRATDAYVTTCDHLIRKSFFAFVLLLVLSLAAGWFGGKIPTSFLPDEDQGFVYAGIQLPDASSLQRTSEAARQAEDLMLKVPGVEHVSTVVGYNMLSGVNSTFNAFFFVSFKPWEERKTPELSYDTIKRNINRALSQITTGIAFSFPPPAIPGVGTSGGVTFILQDRSGKDLSFLTGAKVFGRGAQASRTGQCYHHGAVWRSSGRCDGRQSESAYPAGQSRKRVSDLAGVHGRGAGKLLQPFRATVAGIRPGGRRVSHRRQQPGQVLRQEHDRRDGPFKHRHWH